MTLAPGPIVVTGLGAVTALGASAGETWERVVAGERCFRDVSLFDGSGLKSALVAEVPAISPGPEAWWSRTSELAVRAARQALVDSGIDVRSSRVGLVVGGTTAGMLETESTLSILLSPNEARHDEALSRMLSHPLSAPTDRVARELGPFTRVRSLSSACSSGANALAVAALWLELGYCDAVVAGASESLCRITLSGFSALGALDPEGARPFDVRRKGLTLGEGAGFVVLERAPDAARRKKHAVCTLLGWASRSEAHHITNPEPTGEAPVRAMRAALERAGLSPSDVDYVNAHGTGTPLNDPMETRALTRVLGDAIRRVPVTSQKGQIGHTLGAAGAIEAVITALAIAKGIVPPTGGLEQPDPALGLVHAREAEARDIRVALSSSFGFGGMDTVLVLGKANAPAPPEREMRAVVVTGIATLTPDALLVDEDVARRFEVGRSSSPSVTTTETDLDPERARRLDRASRLAALVYGAALGDDGGDRTDVGIVIGSAFGAVDATAAFMKRLEEKGPRLVRPADFPSLVPSSQAGHASIYLRLGGPALVVADLATSGECAIAQGAELVAAGEADRVCAGAVEERSSIVDGVLSIVFGTKTEAAGRTRREGGAALTLESEAMAARRNARVLARLDRMISWTDDADPLASLGAPPEGAIVVLAGTSAEAIALVDRSPWAECPRVICAETSGTHEAAGSISAAVAASKIACGEASSALFLGTARGWGYAGVFTP